MSDIVKEVEAVALFGCRNDECAGEFSYPTNMLAEHPDGGPICEGCWDEESGLDDPSWSDLAAFAPFDPIASRIKELEGEVANWQERVDLLCKEIDAGAENERLTKANEHHRYMRAMLTASRDAALADNKRLREALSKISSGDGVYGAQAHEYKQIARAALKGDTNDT